MDILYLTLGVSIGISVMIIINAIKTAGYLRIDTTNPNKDVYLIDISKDLNKLPKKKSIILKIDSSYKKPQ